MLRFHTKTCLIAFAWLAFAWTSSADGGPELLKSWQPGGLQLTISEPWVLGQRDGAVATLSINNSADRKTVLSVAVVAASKSGEGWHINLSQTGIKCSAGKTYQLSFSIKGSNIDGLTVGLSQNHEPWGPIPGCDPQYVKVAADWQEVSYKFTVGEEEPNGSLVFSNFNKTGASFSIANLSLRDTSATAQTGSAEGEDLAADLSRWHGTNWVMKASRENNGPEGKDGLKIQASETQYNFLTRSLVYPAEVAKIVFTG